MDALSYRKNISQKAVKLLLWFITVSFAGCVQVTLPSTLQPVNQKEYQAILVCSIAPYSVELVFVDSDSVLVEKLIAKPGSCDTFRVMRFPENTYFYASVINDAAYNELEKYDDFPQALRSNNVLTPSNASAYVCGSKLLQISTLSLGLQNCEDGDQAIRLTELPDNANLYTLLINDPYICKAIFPTCELNSTQELLEWASLLSKSLQVSTDNVGAKSVDFGLFPNALGFNTLDQNGPFIRGVSISEKAAESTPIGLAVAGKVGDQVVAFNGDPIFDRDDLTMLMIQHGMKHPVNIPYTVTLVRNGVTLKEHGYLAFHTDIYRSYFVGEQGICKKYSNSSFLERYEFLPYVGELLACTVKDEKESVFVRDRHCEMSIRNLSDAMAQFCPARDSDQSVLTKMVELIATRIEKLASLSSDDQENIAQDVVLRMPLQSRKFSELIPGVSFSDNWAVFSQQTGITTGIGEGIRLTVR